MAASRQRCQHVEHVPQQLLDRRSVPQCVRPRPPARRRRIDERHRRVRLNRGQATLFVHAATRSAHVAGLLLVDSNGDPGVMTEEQWQQQLTAMRGEHFAEAADERYRSSAGSSEDVLDELLRDLHATDQRTIVGTLEAAHVFRPAHLAGVYAGPRLALVQRAFDTPFAIHRQGRRFPHTTFEGAGQWMQLAAPTRFRYFLDQFLSEVDKA